MRRAATLALLVAAGGVWFGVGVPSRRERDRLRGEWAGARQQREAHRARVSALERRQTTVASPGDAAVSARRLRTAMLRALSGLPLQDVAMAANGQPRSGAQGRLSAVGSQSELLRLGDRLADPGSGFVIRSLRLSEVSGEPGLRRIEVEGVDPRGGA